MYLLRLMNQVFRGGVFNMMEEALDIGNASGCASEPLF
jgi:hypothetical protein